MTVAWETATSGLVDFWRGFEAFQLTVGVAALQVAEEGIAAHWMYKGESQVRYLTTSVLCNVRFRDSVRVRASPWYAGSVPHTEYRSPAQYRTQSASIWCYEPLTMPSTGLHGPGQGQRGWRNVLVLTCIRTGAGPGGGVRCYDSRNAGGVRSYELGGGTDNVRRAQGVEEARRFQWLRQLVEWVQQLNDPQ
eukprot:2040807-Rhodomonas_salina.1